MSRSAARPGGASSLGHLCRRGVRVELEVARPSKPVGAFGGSTDGLGNAAVSFDIGHPRVQIPVVVIANVGNGTAICTTRFTPR